MRAETRTISIETDPVRVVEFLSDPGNLPRWAVGFAKAVRQTPDGWIVETGSGDVPIRIAADAAAGTVDFKMTPAPGLDALAASRAIPRGPATEYVFTQFQAPGMPDEVFEKNVAALSHELKVLKALLEVECPL